MLRNLKVLRGLVRQVGLLDALRLTLAKGVRRLAAPGSKLCYGQTGEDLVLGFLVDKYIGKRPLTFVDVGCHDPRSISNTYLHYVAGWRGLAIDVAERFASSWRRRRPRDRFVCSAVSDQPGSTVLYEYFASEVDTIDPAQAAEWSTRWQAKGQRVVQTRRLADIVAAELPDTAVDVLLLDVEGHEMAVLRGADLASLQPKLIVCEIHGLDLRQSSNHEIVAYLDEAGYRLVAYATMNAYFALASLCE